MAKRLVGILVVVLIVAVGIGLYLAFSSSEPPPSAVVPKARREEAEHRLVDAFVVSSPPPSSSASSGTSVPADKPRSASLRFRDEDIDTVLASDPKVQSQLRQHGVQAMRVSFQGPDLVHLDAWVGLNGASHEVDLEGALTPDGRGGIQFHTDKTQVGLLTIPAGLSADQIDHEIGSYLSSVESKIPIDVQSVTVQNGEMTLAGVKK